MIRIKPNEWTTLNPSAPIFLPKNISKEQNNKEIVNSSAKSDPSVTDQKKKKKSKPSVLTLEQFIAEKLKIEENPKKQAIDVKPKKSKKAETHTVPLNALDSSAPSRKRGKEREVPKPKKATTLKKIIINEKNDKNPKTDPINSEEVHSLSAINRRLLHKRCFREYCDQKLSLSVDQLVVNLLSDLVVFQDRLYSRDPLKAKIKKRLCFGFKEVTKYSKLNKTKLLVIAPDIEKIETSGGLNDCITNLIKISKEFEIPVIFALNRKRLAIVTKKKGFVSCVGVLNYDGSQENFKKLIIQCESQRNEYKSISEQSLDVLEALSEQEVQQIVQNLPNIPKQFELFCETLNPIDRKEVKFWKSNTN